MQVDLQQEILKDRPGVQQEFAQVVMMQARADPDGIQYLQLLKLGPLQLGKDPAHIVERHPGMQDRQRPGASHDQNMRVRIGRHEPVQRLIVARAELEHLHPVGDADQRGQEPLRIAVADQRVRRDRPRTDAGTPCEFHPFRSQQMAMDLAGQMPAQPILEPRKDVRQALDHRIRGRGLAVLGVLAGKAALHIQARPAKHAAMHRLVDDARNSRWLGWIDLGLALVGQREMRQQPRCPRPDLARHETARFGQHVDMVVIKRIRPSGMIELGHGQ